MENQQQLLEIGFGFQSYIYNETDSLLSKPSNIEQFGIENLTLPHCLEEDKIVELATGKNHVLYLTESGKVYGRGWNAYNQLGFSVSDLEEKRSEYEKLSFVKSTFLENYFVKGIVCGYNFSYFKAISLHNNDNKQQYQLYSIGWNYENCCGHLNAKYNSSEKQLQLVHQYKDKEKKVIDPFDFTNDIEFIAGGGSFIVILVKKRDLNQQQACYVVGNKFGLGTSEEGCHYLTEHKQLSNILKYEKAIYLTADTDSTAIITDIGNVYLTGRNMFVDRTLSSFTRITNFDKIEGKCVKQIFYLDSAFLVLTTDNVIYISPSFDSKPYKLEFSTSIKLVYGKGRMAFVITNDNRIYIIYSENINVYKNNPFMLPIKEEDIITTPENTAVIGKFELNLSSVINNYDHFMNYPFDYELKMSGCYSNSFLLIEKKNNSLFANKLFDQLQQNYQEEKRNTFFDIDFY